MNLFQQQLSQRISPTWLTDVISFSDMTKICHHGSPQWASIYDIHIFFLIFWPLWKIYTTEFVLGCVISPLRQQAESQNLWHTFLANSVFVCQFGPFLDPLPALYQWTSYTEAPRHLVASKGENGAYIRSSPIMTMHQVQAVGSLWLWTQINAFSFDDGPSRKKISPCRLFPLLFRLKPFRVTGERHGDVGIL